MNSTTNTAAVVTFVKVQTGIFDAYLNGERTKYQIVNGSLGMSGRNTVNTYGVVNREKDTVRWFGPLRTCKAAVEMSLKKQVELQGGKTQVKVEYR